MELINNIEIIPEQKELFSNEFENILKELDKIMFTYSDNKITKEKCFRIKSKCKEIYKIIEE